jgi:hypothetical protein
MDYFLTKNPILGDLFCRASTFYFAVLMNFKDYFSSNFLTTYAFLIESGFSLREWLK